MDNEYNVEHKVLTQRDYQDAIWVLDAVNLSGIVFSFAKVMQKICDEANQNGKGTNWKNHHPIALMYAEKINELTGNTDLDNWREAYKFCEEEVAAVEA